ncbi:MAG: hypothetical protein ACRD2N_23080 [Vicinamibacterales bacterium]
MKKTPIRCTRVVQVVNYCDKTLSIERLDRFPNVAPTWFNP